METMKMGGNRSYPLLEVPIFVRWPLVYYKAGFVQIKNWEDRMDRIMAKQITAVVCICFGLFCSRAAAQTEVRQASGKMSLSIELTLAASGFNAPVHLATVPGMGGALYVVEEKGRIAIAEPGKKAEGKVFLDLTNPDLQPLESEDKRPEIKLLSLAFHPDFSNSSESRKFYLAYTSKLNGAIEMVVSEFEAISATESGIESLKTGRKLISLNQPYDKHSGGGLAFGPDRTLYIGVGDGGGMHDAKGYAQSLKALFGKILRIDPNERGQGKPYLAPLDNPYVVNNRGLHEIWAYGFRNPWKFSIDENTNQLWVGDRGQDSFEEIDVVVPGGNYGWSIYEGKQCMRMRFDCMNSEFKAPVAEYDHQRGTAVTGGYVYHGSLYPELQGVYVFGDFESGRIWGLKQEGGNVSGSEELLKTNLKISAFGEDNDGELYVADYGKGDIYKMGLKGSAPAEAAKTAEPGPK
jgi:glucose/arabinose dehydrogenase